MDRTLSIRRATSEDISFIVDVVITATRAQGRLPADFDEDDYRVGFADWTAEQIADTDGDSTTSVVEVDGQPVGRLRVVRTAEAVELCGLQLLPNQQSRGIGSLIVTDLIDEAVTSGRLMTLSVELDNPRAQDLYERLGFVETGLGDGEIVMTYPSPSHAD